MDLKPLIFRNEIVDSSLDYIEDGFKVELVLRLKDMNHHNGRDWTRHKANMRVQFKVMTQGRPSAEMVASMMILPAPGNWNEITRVGDDVMRQEYIIANLVGNCRREAYFKYMGVPNDIIQPENEIAFIDVTLRKWQLDQTVQFFETRIDKVMRMAEALYYTR